MAFGFGHCLQTERKYETLHLVLIGPVRNGLFRSVRSTSFSNVADNLKLKLKLRGLSPRANYTDRAAAAGRRG